MGSSQSPTRTKAASPVNAKVLPAAAEAVAPRRQARKLRWPVAAALGAILLFWAVMRFSFADLWVPFTYYGDALHVLALVKGLDEGQWPWYNMWLGAPFGADMREFPLTMATDMVVMKLLMTLFHAPGIVTNIYWMISIALCAGLATYALTRLGIRPAVAACCGIVYALQPFTFARGIHHLSLVFHFVPLIAAGAIEIASGRINIEFDGAPPLQKIRKLLASIPAYLYIACVLQGFAHIYNAFFACFLLAAAAVIGAVAHRRRTLVLISSVLIAIIASGAVMAISPSLLFWRTHGKRVDYKRPAEAEVYGLKIRHLLTPIPDHPLPYFRHLTEKVRSAMFPNENENTTSKLGTVGSIGFLLLLGYALIRCAGSGTHDPVLGPCAALLIGALLLATVGGFSSFFNVFVAPDIRAYNRIVVFISFFCVTAVGAIASRKLAHIRPMSRSGILAGVIACVLTGAAVADQASTSAYRSYAERRTSYEQDRLFVAAVEGTVGTGGMIMQLPFTDFPVDPGVQRLGAYEHAKPYLHSTGVKWSWGAMAVREGSWNLETSSLPPDKMLPVLAAAEITGLWVDEAGYAIGSSPVEAIAQVTATPPVWNANRRVAFFNLQPYIARLRTGISAADQENAKVKVLHPVRAEYENFDPEEANADRRWRWCSGDCTIVVRNPAPFERKVSFITTLQTGSGPGAPVVITTSGSADSVLVPSSTRPYHRLLRIKPNSSVTIRFQTDAPLVLPPPARPMRLAILNPSVSADE